MNSYEKSLQKVRFGHFTSFVKSGTEFDLSDPSISDDFTSFIDLHLIFLDQFPLLFRNYEQTFPHMYDASKLLCVLVKMQVEELEDCKLWRWIWMSLFVFYKEERKLVKKNQMQFLSLLQKIPICMTNGHNNFDRILFRPITCSRHPSLQKFEFQSSKSLVMIIFA